MLNFRRARAAHLRLGCLGERAAARLLRRLGMEILVRNWRCRAGELDLVARDGATLVFVEVKTRSPNPLRRPEENLSFRQCRRNLRAARYYLRQLKADHLSCRFELITVIQGRFFLHEIRRHRDYLPPEAVRAVSGRR